MIGHGVFSLCRSQMLQVTRVITLAQWKLQLCNQLPLLVQWSALEWEKAAAAAFLQPNAPCGCFPAAERSGERSSCTGGNDNNGIYNCSANFSCGAQVYVNSFPIARGRGITEGLLQLIETHDWRQMEADRSMNREDQWYRCKWQRPS